MKSAYDVIVLGSGGAGMAACLFARLNGLSTLLVERTEYLGGTTAFSAATAWVPGSLLAASVGAPPDDITQARTFLNETVGNHSNATMRDAFLHWGPQAIARLQGETQVQFRARPLHPDYIQDAPGATLRGRALEPLPFDGRKLGKRLDLIRPPIPEFTILGGLMIDRDDIAHLLKMTKTSESFLYAAKLIGRYGIDRLTHKRGTRLVMGNALIGRLLSSLDATGADIVTQTETETLLNENGRITGVRLRQNSRVLDIIAQRGVVMATGGFNRHPTRRAEMLLQPTAAYSPSAPGHTGEIHDLALSLGAHYGEGAMDNAFWAPVSIRRRADGTTAVFPHFVLDRGKPGTISVNAAGRRFVNESTSYHLFTRAMYESNKTVPTIPAFLIADAEALRKYGLGMVRPGGRRLKPFLDDGYLVEAPTLSALADKLDINAAGLEESVKRMNEFARTGVDTEFGRGSTDYHRVNGDATHGPNPNIGPITAAPFYAVRLLPGDIGAATGMVTNAYAQVMKRDGTPIPSLYAVGNDMQSVMGGVYPGPGITVGPGLAFAYAAATHLTGSL
ncbi:FAD-dependent oxidoreductase [Acidocella aminolytica]|jgi:succinate dehydrogenase/fumarate reductase flavoprotein subunit|uniref:FAD binding dehydrogenase n=1 Tax=Acidocella aminolytica 101 = DSM 11237 TaxID=1120923 RepID=A0A0D6PE14_9PROT|nr:FAD-dependent oxidoreductase [Acidocella aminolytica]GAN79591.1 FAD binding dehydrogenase [Acidocella aminolytica 101 = DSM 11237]GBQ39057.1 fumarate reductase [Acidocella aminolytica 101 = DSM 11237]SHF27497.1 Succinate dehydrogenase/fumarate reductase, flavoprotein subunit [Acidocella aminolytica 101 = DSM 11237]